MIEPLVDLKILDWKKLPGYVYGDFMGVDASHRHLVLALQFGFGAMGAVGAMWEDIWMYIQPSAFKTTLLLIGV